MISIERIKSDFSGTIYYKNSRNKWKRNMENYRKAKRELENKYGERCLFCNKKLTNNNGDKDHYSLEHLKEKSKYENMASDIQNLVLACVGCNGKRGDKDIGETPVSIKDIYSSYQIKEDGRICTTDCNIYMTILSYGLNRSKLVEERKKIISFYKKSQLILEIDWKNICGFKKDALDFPAVTLTYASLMPNYQAEKIRILNHYYYGGL